MTEEVKTKAAHQAADRDAAEIDAKDLDLVDDRLADEGKTDEDLWGEMEAVDAGTVNAADRDAREDDRETGADADDVDNGDDADEGKGGTDDGADIWANATPEQKAAFEALKSERDEFKGKFDRHRNQVSGLQKRINKLNKSLEARQGEDRKPSSDRLAKIKDDYPELAEPMTEALGEIESRFDAEETSRRTAAEQELRDAQEELGEIIEAQEAALEAAHPDWRKFLSENGEAFRAWVDDQPRMVRDAAARNADAIVDAASASMVLASFAEHLSGKTADKQPSSSDKTETNQPLNDRRARQLDATSSPRSRSGGRPTVSGIPEDGDPEQIWAAFDAQEQAQSRV